MEAIMPKSKKKQEMTAIQEARFDQACDENGWDIGRRTTNANLPEGWFQARYQAPAGELIMQVSPHGRVVLVLPSKLEDFALEGLAANLAIGDGRREVSEDQARAIQELHQRMRKAQQIVEWERKLAAKRQPGADPEDGGQQ